MAKAAVLTGWSPSTTSPRWFTQMSEETLTWPKCMPKGFTQKRSPCSGSLAVMWPATPSSKPPLGEEAKGRGEPLLAIEALDGGVLVGAVVGMGQDLSHVDSFASKVPPLYSGAIPESQSTPASAIPTEAAASASTRPPPT